MMLVNVCACFDVQISHGWPAKLPRRCSFFLFDRSAYFFSFPFFFLQCFWPCPFFFLQGPMLSWKVIIWIVLLSLHGATRSTRFCNNRASLSAWLSFFLQHVGQHRSKNDHEAKQKKVSASTNMAQIFTGGRSGFFFCWKFFTHKSGMPTSTFQEQKQ